MPTEAPILPSYEEARDTRYLDDIERYYYGDTLDRPIALPVTHDERSKKLPGWIKYLLPLLYTAFMVSATFMHASLMQKTSIPYFLMAVYNSITTVVALVFIIINSFIRSHQRESEIRGQSRWKPFAYILLYIFSEEGFWLSLENLPLMRWGFVYLGYPMFVAFFTYEWVFLGNGERVKGGVYGRDGRNLKIAAAGGLLVLCWGYETSFEWWGAVVGVGMLAFKDVITRDILMEGENEGADMLMLASSALAFRGLTACYNSVEYNRVWPGLTRMGPHEWGMAIGVGVCYGMAQMTGLGILKVWEPVTGGVGVVMAAAVTILGCAISMI